MTRRVAIIGAAHRFPAADGESFWESLKNGTDLVTEVDRQRWDHEIYQHPNRQHPGTSVTFAAGSLGDGIDEFDATFFGISPREAAHMDPQQRLLLELAWEATEHAGIPASNMRGTRCGVYVGISSLDYAYRHADDLEALDSPSATGNTSSIAANRISYVFDLKGPSMAVDTACSSSLVAFHQACQAIRAGECDTALAGGVSLHLHPFGFIVFTKASMLSANGRCRVFDESGDGYVRSEGAGLFLLKDYDQALADGDRILAVVAGTAVNTDGHKTGLTVPNPDAQIALMRQAYADAGIDIEDIDYLEAHGTGTAVGDPIETHAIGHALGMARSRPLPIGSVKSNIGHLETASGVAGLAKALYSLMHREVPATIGIRKLNPHIKQDEWNLDIVTEARPLPAEGTLTIGVNSFGFGGANAHVILQSPQETQPAADPQHSAGTHSAPASSTSASGTTASSTTEVAERRLPLRISAQCDNGLREQARRLADLLEHGSDSLYDIAHALETQRAQLKHGAVIISDDRTQACSALRAFAKREDSRNEVITLQRQSDAQGPVFVYSGNGCQWETMGRALLDHCPVFSATIDQVDELFRPQGSFSIREELEGLNGSERFERTEIAQPALFALQVGLTASLRHWGITPSAVVGHSVGEVAAAWACGALSLEDAVAVITQRSHFQGLTKGKGVMTAAVMDAESARTWLDDPRFKDIALAGDNSVRGVTLAGPRASMEALEECLVEQQIACFRLPLDYAFHSSAMAPIEQDVISALAGISPRVSEIPFYSTVSGELFDTSALDANYWWLNIRQPVRFTEALRQLFDAKANVFVEIGAHPVLKRYLQDAQKDSGHACTVISSLQRDGDSVRDLQKCLGQLWLSGIALNTHEVFPITGRFVELPHYPWQRQQHWMPGTGHKWGLIERHLEHPLLGYRQALFDGVDKCWQSQLDVERLPWLADHSVGNAPVFPGAGYVEMSLAAAIHHREAQTIELESLEILAPMMLDAPHGRRSRLRLDRHQGHIHIESRDTQEAGDWQLNAKARVLSDSLGTLLEREAPALPQRQPDVTLQQHLAMASRVGLDYGPAFQALEGIWREGDTIIGQFGETARPEEALQHLSPGRLDCAFQLFLPLLADSEAAASGFAFVPVRIDRLQMRTDAGLPVLATATLRKRAPHSFTADFSLFDASGVCVAHLDATRFRLVRLKQTESTSLSFVANVLTPAPHPHTPVTMTWDAVEDSLGRLGDRVALATRSRYAEELSPLLDRLSEAFADQALVDLGHAERLEKADLEHYHAQYPDTAQQWHHLLTQLEDAGILVSDDNGWTRQSNDEEPSRPQIRPEAIWQMMIGEYPDALPLIQRVGRHGLNLLGLLQGTIEADSLGLTPEHLAALVPHTLSPQGWACLGEHLCAALQEHITGLAVEQRLSIVEAGIAVPRLGEWFSGLLDADRVDLALLPSDDDGLHQASRLKERHPLIQVASLSDDTTPSAQAQFAVISISPESRETAGQQLSQLARHLKPDARLVVLYTPPSHWWDSLCASPGLDSLHGKSCEAEDLQELLAQWSSSPIQRISLEQADQGMQLYCMRFSPSSTAQEKLLSQEELLPQEALLSQETPSAHDEDVSDEAAGTLEAHYLLIANSENAAQAQNLETALQATGLSATCCDPDALAQEALSLDEIAPEASSLHLIDLRGLSRASDETEQCTWLATWVKLLEGLERPHRLWIMTQGVAALLQVHRPLIDAVSGMPLAAASWGFARSMANEISHSHVTLVDTPPCSDGKWSSALLQAMSNELSHPDNETELAYDAEGRRYAVRLRVMPQPSPVQVPADSFDEAQGKHPASTAETQQLTVTLPGQLRHLTWKARPLPDVGADDVQVQVRATGLNFRDVMYTLGLLSDEAIENGFAGATLGLEFSGVVERVGSNITDLSPGDSVVGFGPNSFSERLVASRSALTALPAGIDFAAAATIPTTFFTVYYALKHLAQVEPGERVLIHGGAGGVGLAAIQIARWLGAELYVTVGSEEKADFLRLYGVERIYHSRQLTYAEEILRDTQGKGVDVVLNSLAGEAIAQNFRALAPFGRFLELGKRDFYENTPVGLRPFRNNLSYFGIDSDQLMKEKPELTARLFREMMALFEDGTLHPLPYTAFDHHRVIEAFRYMQQARQIGKLVVTREPQQNLVEERARHEDETPTPRTAAFTLDRQASYLVTGGLSGFGLSTAEWLARRGAGHLILLSRRGPASEEAQQGIERLRALDVEVTALACDITDREALAAVIAECGTTLPPLKGIVHAATVIDDGLIRHLDRERIERVLAPKILGARYLHELTQHQPLDLFVLYSSATTLFGNPGQANYVAANCWLEGLAAYRRQQGLAATCVYWGAIEDVGFLARNTRTLEALQERLGGSALQSAAALDTLGQLLATQQSHVGVLELDWHALARFLPTDQAPRFHELSAAAGDSNEHHDNGSELLEQLQCMTAEEMHSTLVSVLRNELATILLIDPEQIDSQQSVYELGFDSLMGVELMTAIEARLNIQLPVMVMSEATSLDKLAQVLVRKLTQGESEEEDGTRSALALANAHGSEEAVALITEEPAQ